MVSKRQCIFNWSDAVHTFDDLVLFHSVHIVWSKSIGDQSIRRVQWMSWPMHVVPISYWHSTNVHNRACECPTTNLYLRFWKPCVYAWSNVQGEMIFTAIFFLFPMTDQRLDSLFIHPLDDLQKFFILQQSSSILVTLEHFHFIWMLGQWGEVSCLRYTHLNGWKTHENNIT